MSSKAVEWSKKTREFQHHHFDSTVWNQYKFRKDDVIIATYGKAGTTWTQQIVGQIVFNGDENVEIGAISPWLGQRLPHKEFKRQIMEA